MTDTMRGKAEVTYALMMHARLLAREGLQGDAELILIKALEQARQEGMDEAADTIESLRQRNEELKKQIFGMAAGEAGLSNEEIKAFRDRYLIVDTQRFMDDALLRAWLKLGITQTADSARDTE